MYLGTTSPTITNLTNGKYLFINCFYSDRYSGGAETPRGDLEVTYTYRVRNYDIGIKYAFEDKPLVNNDGTYILPLTHEYLGDDFLNYSTRDTLHSIYVTVKDNVGNIDIREYSFSINYDPNASYPLN